MGKLLVSAALVILGLQSRVQATVVASDNSGDAVYNSGWTSGSNGGFGFGAWTLQTSGGNAGMFQASATNNDDGTSSAGNINALGDAFGMYANSGDRSAGYRSFNLTNAASALAAGYTFNWSMDNGGVDDGGASVGLSLRTGNSAGDASDGTIFAGRRFGFEFLQGSGDYKIFDSSGVRNTGIGWRRTGLNLSLTLTAADAYSLSVADASSGSALGTFTGSLAGTAGAALNSFSIYNRFAGGGGPRDLYFNNFSVSAVPEASQLLAIPLAAAAVLGRRAWKRRPARRTS
ncbi:MAG: hypothetical protein IT424_12385 [Pirellulales bacterium]|nr:hypothetical protein [Pirellulales bacterium]